MDKLRVLILCDAFGAPAYMPRIVNLCKNIAHSCKCTVCAEKLPDENFSTSDFTLLQMPYYPTRHGLKYLFLWLLHFLFNYKDHRFYKFITFHVDVSSYDIILCSTFNLFPLITAGQLARKHNIKFVADLRDIAEQWGDTSYFTQTFGGKLSTRLIQNFIEKVNIARRNRVLRRANALTTISTWHVDFLKTINSNTHLIFNGYDQTAFKPQKIATPTFDIVYTGRLYNLDFRNPDLLFQAIERLDNERKISPDLLRIVWHSDAHDAIIARARHFNIESYIDIKPFVPVAQMPEVLNKASICLILTRRSTTNGPHGIMTTKFFEAIGVAKPVLCVESDGECLAREIEVANAGLAASTVEQVEQFVLSLYNEWQQTHCVQSSPINRARYSRSYGAEQFLNLFHSLLSENSNN